MVVSCTQCQTKFRVDDNKIGPRGVKVRCSKCQNTFVVRLDGAAPAPAAAPPQQALPPSPVEAHEESVFESTQVAAGPQAATPYSDPATDLFEGNAVGSAPAPQKGLFSADNAPNIGAELAAELDDHMVNSFPGMSSPPPQPPAPKMPAASAPPSPFDFEEDVTLPGLGADLMPKTLDGAPAFEQPTPAPLFSPFETPSAHVSDAPPSPAPQALPPPLAVPPPLAPPPLASPPPLTFAAPPAMAPPAQAATPAFVPPAPALADKPLGDDLFDLPTGPTEPPPPTATAPAKDAVLSGLPDFGEDEQPSFEGGIGADGAVTKAPTAAPLARVNPVQVQQASLELETKKPQTSTQRPVSRSDLPPPPPPRVRIQVALWVVWALTAASLAALWWAGGIQRFVAEVGMEGPVRVGSVSVTAYPTRSPSGALALHGVVTNDGPEASRPLRLSLTKADGKKVVFVPGKVFDASEAYLRGESIPSGDAVSIPAGATLSFNVTLKPNALQSLAPPAIELAYD